MSPRPGPWWADRQPAARTTSWTWRSTVTVVIISLIIMAGIGFVLRGVQVSSTGTWDYGITQRPTVEALAARCGPIVQFTNPPSIMHIGTVPDTDAEGNPTTLGYLNTVPMMGPMHTTPVDTSTTIYWSRSDADAPRPEQVLRSLWDGWMVAYYSLDANPNKVDELRRFAEANPEMKMMVVPWPKDKQPLPNNKEIAFAAWANVQLCVDFINSQIRTFRQTAPISAAPGADGTKPEALTYEQTRLQVLAPSAEPTAATEPTGAEVADEEPREPDPAEASPTPAPSSEAAS